MELTIPQEFYPMSEEIMQQKYVSNQPPIMMYTNSNGDADFGISQTSTALGNDIQILRDMYRAGIRTLYDEVQFFQDTVSNINGEDYIVFEFIGTIMGDDNAFTTNRSLSKYIYIMYIPYAERVLVFNFNTAASRRSYWQDKAEVTMNSIRFR